MNTVLETRIALHPPPVTPAAAARRADGGSVGTWRTWLGTAAVTAAVLAQGAVLARGGWKAGMVIATAVIALTFALAWHLRSRVRHADVLIATAAFGGLGMMLGDAVAAGGFSAVARHGAMQHGPANHAIHQAASAQPSLATWLVATGVMLVTCALACRWTCAPVCAGGRIRRALAHLPNAAAMIGGMMAFNAILTPVLTPALGPDVAMHVAMVLGMAIGVGISIRLVASAGAR